MDQPTDKGDYIGLPWINGGLKRINCALYERLVETHLDVDVISNSDVWATVTLERWATNTQVGATLKSQKFKSSLKYMPSWPKNEKRKFKIVKELFFRLTNFPAKLNVQVGNWN